MNLAVLNILPNNSSIVKFRHLNTFHGLSSDVANCIISDSFGFIWVGTESGLNRFDGKNVVKYYNTEDENSITNNVIKCLYVDSKGNLWIGTDYGLNLYNYKTERFKRIYSESGNTKLSSNSILSIAEDLNGDIWIGTSQGLNFGKYNKKQEKYEFKRLHHNIYDENTISNDRVYALYFDNNNNLWIGTEGGGLNLLSYNNWSENNFTFKKFKYTNANSISSNFVYSICQSENGNIFIGTNKGVDILTKAGKEYKIVQIPLITDGKDYMILSLEKDDIGNIWMGCFGGGLYQYNTLSGEINKYSNSIYSPHSLSRNYITGIEFAPDGHLWISIRESGADYVNTKNQKFFHINQLQNNKNYNNRVVKSVIEDEDGNIVFGSYGSPLSKYNHTMGKTEPYFNKYNKISFVETLCRDNNNNLWIGTKSGLYLYDKQKKKTLKFTTQNGLSDNNIWDLFYDNFRNCIWIGTFNGLSKINLNDYSISKILHSNENFQSISFNYIRKVFVDSKQNLWIGTFGGGLNLLKNKGENDPKKMQFEVFKHSHQHSKSISSNFVNTIFEDSENNIWVGTQNGINKFNPKNKSFEYFTTNHGLADNIVKGILEDNSGKLWISTQNGISRLNTNNKSIKNYYSNDGLQDDIFNLNACYKGSNSLLYFGGKNGITYFNPEDINERKIIYTPYLKELIINNRHIKPKDKYDNITILNSSLLNGKEITIPSGFNSFSLSFSSISFGNKTLAEYHYKLSPVENEFIIANEYNNKVSYSNLEPGNYKFTLTDKYHNNIKNVDIKILPPFWKSISGKFLKAFIFLTLILLSYFIIRRRINQKKVKLLESERIKNIEEMNEFKLRFFTNISHEFRTPLTLISGPVQKLYSDEEKLSGKQRSYYYNIINHNINILLNLVNQLLDFRRLNSKNNPLMVQDTNLMDLLSLYEQTFSHYCERKNISLTFSKKCEKLNIYLDISRFERVMYNLLSNAVKYTDIGGSIEISVHTNVFELPKEVIPDINENALKDYLVIAVKDSGLGIPEDKLNYIFERFTTLNNNNENGESSGIGLAFSREIARQHKGDITLQSKEAKGSIFYLWLPSDESYYSKSEKEKPEEYEFVPIEESVEITESTTGEEPETESTSDSKRTILVVDDYKELRVFIKNILNKDYNIIEAENGEEAFELALKSGPDLIITDVMMPIMDGISFCNKIKHNISISHTPLIMLTAKSSNEHEIEGLESGADAYIKKPFDPKYLEVVIKNILKNRKLSHDYFNKGIVPKEEHLKIANKEEELLKKVNDLIIENIDNNDFNVSFLASNLGLSTVHLYRKLKSLTGMSTNEYVSKQKLKYAAELLKQGSLRITEVAYMSGYSDPKYFRKCFKKEFGCSPSEYR